MKFLLDQFISPGVATLLNGAGHDAAHLRDYGMQSAEDPAILILAEKEGRVLVTADSDFSAILTLGRRRKPSCIIFR